MFMSVVLEWAYNETTVSVSDIIELVWKLYIAEFTSRLQNEVTNVSACTKHKSYFIVRICLHFFYKPIWSCVGFQIFTWISFNLKLS